MLFKSTNVVEHQAFLLSEPVVFEFVSLRMLFCIKMHVGNVKLLSNGMFCTGSSLALR